MARSGGHPQGKRRTAAVLGLHGPGSEGNLASDNENTPDAVTTTTPQDEQDKPSERPHERPARENGPTRDQSNAAPQEGAPPSRSEEHTSELQSLRHLVCRLLLEKKKKKKLQHSELFRVAGRRRPRAVRSA